MFPAEAFVGTLLKLVRIFEDLSIRFHLTGGITSIAYGEPRLTQDVDIVISNEDIAPQIEEFRKAATNSGFLFDADEIETAVSQRGMFQLLDKIESLKIDLYAREMIPGELQRSEKVEIFEGIELPLTSYADAAASKLAWIDKGSHKSRQDLRLMFSSAEPAIQEKIKLLASDLNLSELLAEVLSESNEIE